MRFQIVCVWVLMYVCVHARMDGCVHILVRLHIHILDIYICIYIYIQGPNVLFSVYIIHIHICIYIYICGCMCMYIYICICCQETWRGQHDRRICWCWRVPEGRTERGQLRAWIQRRCTVTKTSACVIPAVFCCRHNWYDYSDDHWTTFSITWTVNLCGGTVF